MNLIVLAAAGVVHVQWFVNLALRSILHDLGEPASARALTFWAPLVRVWSHGNRLLLFQNAACIVYRVLDELLLLATCTTAAVCQAWAVRSAPIVLTALDHDLWEPLKAVMALPW